MNTNTNAKAIGIIENILIGDRADKALAGAESYLYISTQEEKLNLYLDGIVFLKAKKQAFFEDEEENVAFRTGQRSTYKIGGYLIDAAILRDGRISYYVILPKTGTSGYSWRSLLANCQRL